MNYTGRWGPPPYIGEPRYSLEYLIYAMEHVATVVRWYGDRALYVAYAHDCKCEEDEAIIKEHALTTGVAQLDAIGMPYATGGLPEWPRLTWEC